MNFLLSQDSLRILESLSFTDTLYSFDFDGTLAPIVNEPSEAYMEKSTEVLLSKLTARVPTAIISGRSLQDLKSRVPFEVPYMVGNHGLEGLPRSTPLNDLKRLPEGWKEVLTETLINRCDDSGIILEDKTYSLAIHYRKSRAKSEARSKILAAIKDLATQPRVIPGKLVFNLIPAGGPHKGVALSRLIEHSGQRFSFYIGDDDTDEDVFSLPDYRILSVSVGNRKGSAAKYFIKKQPDIDETLRRILGFYGVKT